MNATGEAYNMFATHQYDNLDNDETAKLKLNSKTNYGGACADFTISDTGTDFTSAKQR